MDVSPAMRRPSKDLLNRLLELGVIASPLELDRDIENLRGLIDEFVGRWSLPNGDPRPSVEVAVYVPEGFVPFKASATTLTQTPEAHRYAILIVDDTIRRLRDTVHRIMAHRDCFTDVGNPELETELPPIAKIYETMSGVRDAAGGEYSLPIPRCPSRRQYAEVLLRYALLAVGLHELGHIAHGHLRLHDLDQLPKVQRRALEAAADAYAAFKLVELALRPPPDELRDGYPTERERMRVVVRALHLVFLHEEGSALYRQPDPESRIHPLPRRRQILSVSACRDAFVFLRGGDDAWLLDGQISVDCEKAYRAISGAESDPGYLSELWRTPLEGEPMALWQVVLRPRLASLTYHVLMTAGPNAITNHTTVTDDASR